MTHDPKTHNGTATDAGHPTRGASTTAVHGKDARRDEPYHALTTPILQSATFTFRDSDDVADYMARKYRGDGAGEREEYGRYGNPTVVEVERKLAALDGGEAAVLYPSGMAAVSSALLTMLSPGAHVVIGDDIYRHTYEFCTTFLKRFGVETTVVPMGDYDALEAAIIPRKTRLIVSESPTNPYGRVVDLVRLAEIGKRQRVRTFVDSTFATPVNQRPLEFGIDFVMHSATKFLAGHNDLLAGVVIGRADRMAALRESRGLLGGIVDPGAAYLLDRGLKTLGVRVRQQNESALALARFLEGHPAIERVWYPGLESHPEHAIARAQMSGFGGVVTFIVRGDRARTSAFIDRLRIPYIAPSLGGVESLIQQPALMSHFDLTPEERLAQGVPDNLVRFSTGIEDTADLLADFEQALAGG
ncbi:MAG: PLP-dependent transferase [Anaerolineae bacterium]|nr:PLP-dependent transferase [Anaerolineae bacterium]